MEFQIGDKAVVREPVLADGSEGVSLEVGEEVEVIETLSGEGNVRVMGAGGFPQFISPGALDPIVSGVAASDFPGLLLGVLLLAALGGEYDIEAGPNGLVLAGRFSLQAAGELAALYLADAGR